MMSFLLWAGNCGAWEFAQRIYRAAKAQGSTADSFQDVTIFMDYPEPGRAWVAHTRLESYGGSHPDHYASGLAVDVDDGIGGYRNCACRDCFEIAIGRPGAMCHECETAGCELGEHECDAPGAYGGSDQDCTLDCECEHNCACGAGQ